MSSKPLLVLPPFPGWSGPIARELACDELLLLEAESHDGPGLLRFWIPAATGVVAGYSNAVDREINLQACENRQIPVFRRISGGGSVVQSPGCLNFSVIFPIASDPHFGTAGGTSREIVGRTMEGLRTLLPGKSLAFGGDGDLTVEGRKVLGSAQKRLVRCFLFHASLLLDLDIGLVADLLPLPSKEPSYREGRDHGKFLTNLNLPAEAAVSAITREWGIDATRPYPELSAVDRLAGEKYRPLGAVE
jgi:lipoate-protein ligase A